MARVTEKSEIERLTKIYETLPPKQLALAQGLIVQAARIRVRLDELSADINEHGMTEIFQQSEKCNAYSRTRHEAELFVKLDKNYQSVIKQLDGMIPRDDAPAEDVFSCD